MNKLFFEEEKDKLAKNVDFWNKQNLPLKADVLNGKNTILFEGFLNKKSKIFSNNIKRYYYIVNNVLYYAKVIFLFLNYFYI